MVVPLAGRDYNTVDMSERRLREMYLPGYKAGLDAGAKLVMTSFNTVDGILLQATNGCLETYYEMNLALKGCDFRLGSD